MEPKNFFIILDLLDLCSRFKRYPIPILIPIPIVIPIAIPDVLSFYF